MNQIDLANRVAIITGGARGIGLAAAQRFAASGAKLALWDLSKSDKPSDIKPGLATSWEVDPNNHKRWIYHLREGVKWHDGCPFTADDVLWNFARITDPKAPQYYTQQMALSRAYTTNFDSVEKIDDHTVAINTKVVESLFPYQTSYILMISRCRAENADRRASRQDKDNGTYRHVYQ